MQTLSGRLGTGLGALLVAAATTLAVTLTATPTVAGTPGVSAVAADSAPTRGAAAAATVSVQFDELRKYAAASSAVATGSVPVTASMSASGGGVAIARGRAGNGLSLDLPAFGDAAGSPRSVLRLVQRTGGADLFAPYAAPFSFGADFMLDGGVTSTAGSADSGDNLVQRGLGDQVGQYKLEVDGRTPSCTLRGRVGGTVQDYRLSLASNPGWGTASAGTWYRARCERSSATSMRLLVWPVGPGGGLQAGWSVSRTLPATLVIAPTSRTVPFSAGGKLLTSGAVHPQADQFNGQIDNVRYQR